jgi:hypothetical protein
MAIIKEQNCFWEIELSVISPVDFVVAFWYLQPSRLSEEKGHRGSLIHSYELSLWLGFLQDSTSASHGLYCI